MTASPCILKAGWNISGNCNMNCRFCYNFCTKKSVSTSEAKKIIEKLFMGGVKYISFGGGDPLLRDDLIELVAFSKELGLMIGIDTNGIAMSIEKMIELAQYASIFSIPLDGPSSEIHFSMRPYPNHFNMILDLIDKIRELGIYLRINTLATKVNISKIPSMVALLSDYSIRDWRILEFVPLGKGSLNKEVFEISGFQFDVLKESVLKQHFPFKVEFFTNEERAQAYFLISQDGSVYSHPAKGDYVFFGNMLSDSLETIVEQGEAKGLFDRKKHFLRYGNGFGFEK